MISDGAGNNGSRCARATRAIKERVYIYFNFSLEARWALVLVMISSSCRCGGSPNAPRAPLSSLYTIYSITFIPYSCAGDHLSRALHLYIKISCVCARLRRVHHCYNNFILFCYTLCPLFFLSLLRKIILCTYKRY